MDSIPPEIIVKITKSLSIKDRVFLGITAKYYLFILGDVNKELNFTNEKTVIKKILYNAKIHKRLLVYGYITGINKLVDIIARKTNGYVLGKVYNGNNKIIVNNVTGKFPIDRDNIIVFSDLPYIHFSGKELWIRNCRELDIRYNINKINDEDENVAVVLPTHSRDVRHQPCHVRKKNKYIVYEQFLYNTDINKYDYIICPKIKRLYRKLKIIDCRVPIYPL